MDDGSICSIFIIALCYDLWVKPAESMVRIRHITNPVALCRRESRLVTCTISVFAFSNNSYLMWLSHSLFITFVHLQMDLGHKIDVKSSLGSLIIPKQGK